VAGGSSPQNVEVMKTFLRRCPAVLVTGNREKADFVVRLDHQEPNPTTLFVRANKVAVFNKNNDLIYSTPTRTLTSAVKSACEAIAGGPRK
jgi:coproporphyrinogen III oxidase-like Fe-S oxidoreductase